MPSCPLIFFSVVDMCSFIANVKLLIAVVSSPFVAHNTFALSGERSVPGGAEVDAR